MSGSNLEFGVVKNMFKQNMKIKRVKNLWTNVRTDKKTHFQLSDDSSEKIIKAVVSVFFFSKQCFRVMKLT